jgi:hypothetical protein
VLHAASKSRDAQFEATDGLSTLQHHQGNAGGVAEAIAERIVPVEDLVTSPAQGVGGRPSENALGGSVPQDDAVISVHADGRPLLAHRRLGLGTEWELSTDRL